MEKGVKYEFYENILFIWQSSADYCCSVVLDRMKISKHGVTQSGMSHSLQRNDVVFLLRGTGGKPILTS